jgi:hypothetical protein
VAHIIAFSLPDSLHALRLSISSLAQAFATKAAPVLQPIIVGLMSVALKGPYPLVGENNMSRFKTHQNCAGSRISDFPYQNLTQI